MTEEDWTALSAALWDLSAQVEGQLRCLTKIHRMHDRPAQPGDKETIVSELEDVLRMNHRIGTSCELSIEHARELPPDQ